MPALLVHFRETLLGLFTSFLHIPLLQNIPNGEKTQGWGGGGAGGYLDSSFLGIPAGTGFTGAAAVAGGRGAVLGRRLTGLYVITSLHAPCLSQYIAGTYAVPHILQTQ